MRLSLASAMLAVLGASFIAAPASADVYGVAYYGMRGSYVWTDEGTTHGSLFFDYNEEYEEGFAGAVYIGWILDDSFRLEIEGGYRSADLDRVVIVRDDTGDPLALPPV